MHSQLRVYNNQQKVPFLRNIVSNIMFLTLFKMHLYQKEKDKLAVQENEEMITYPVSGCTNGI